MIMVHTDVPYNSGLTFQSYAWFKVSTLPRIPANVFTALCIVNCMDDSNKHIHSMFER